MAESSGRDRDARRDAGPGTPRWADAVQWAVVLAMFGAGALAWPWLPDAIPVHWNAAGQVDRMGGKLEGAFLLPGIAALVALALRVLPRIDPHRAHYAEFAGSYAVARLAIVALLAAVQALVLLAAAGVPIAMTPAISVLVGLLLVVIGLGLDRVRPNWFYGIRTPWTLSSERAWTATHRLGRPVFALMGLAIVGAGLLRTGWAFALAGALCALAVAGLFAYSYRVWRDDPDRRRA